MSFFLPYRKITIKSDLLPNDIIDRLSNEVEHIPEGTIAAFHYWKKSSLYFTRKPVDNDFRLARKAYNRSNGMTDINGMIRYEGGSTTISLKIWLSPIFIILLLVFVMLPVWYFVREFGMIMISASYTFSGDAHPWTFIPLSIPVVILYCMIMINFSIQCSHAKKFMLAVTKGKLVISEDKGQ